MAFVSFFKKKFLFGILLYSSLCYPQQKSNTITFLREKLATETSDTTRSLLLSDLSFQLYLSQPDSALTLANLAYDIAKTNNFSAGKAKALFCMSAIKQSYSKYDEALNYLNQSFTIYQDLKRDKELAKLYNSIGLAYLYKNEYPKALENFYNSLKKYETQKDILGQAVTNGNIGLVYYKENNYEKCLPFLTLALKLDEKENNEDGIARHTGNIGNIYLRKGSAFKLDGDLKQADEMFRKALGFYNKALQIAEGQDNKSNMAMHIGNMANVFYDMGDITKTIEYYKKAYNLSEKMGDKIGMSRQLGNTGWVYFEIKNFKEAEISTKQAVELIKNTSAIDLLYNWYDNLSAIYEEDGNYKEAHKFYKQAIILRDSLYSIDKAKKTLEAEMNFEFEKKEAVARKESERQTLIRNVFVAGFGVMFLMVLLIFRSYRIKRKANREVSKQKELLELKNKEITDSIRYAKRIQNAHLPSNEYITKKLMVLKNKV